MIKFNYFIKQTIRFYFERFIILLNKTRNRIFRYLIHYFILFIIFYSLQTFGFSSTDREQLDNWMVHAFQKNIPPHFNLLSTPSGMVPSHKNYMSK